MSIDRSLHSKSGVSSSRNVLKRAERIAMMIDNENFDPNTSSPLGIPKTRVKSTSGGKGGGKAAEKAPEAEKKAE